MERFDDEADTAEVQRRRLELKSTFINYSFQVLSRHEMRMLEFYSAARQIKEPIVVPTFIDGQPALPIPEFSK